MSNVNDIDWNKFVDSGKVSNTVLIRIAFDVVNSKILSDRQVSIYAEYSEIIEEIINKFKQISDYDQ